jgi:hypothetical protein
VIIDKYFQQISELSQKAEKLGEEGDVDGAEDAIKKSESLKALKVGPGGFCSPRHATHSEASFLHFDCIL